MTHQKQFLGFVRGTNEKKYAKIAALNFEICGRRCGLKNTQKLPISMNKKVFYAFFEKTSRRKNCLYSPVTPLVKFWGTSLRKQKNELKNSRNRMDFFGKKSEKLKYLKN